MKHFNKYIGIIIAVVAVVALLPTHQAYAFLGINVIDTVNAGLAEVVTAALSTTGLLLTFAAGILNVSIVITLHIREFVNNTPAIYTIWQTIRDVTGIFFIFFLLYAAIEMILSRGSSYGKLVVNIVVAGILINFSFFIVSVLIDASNITSQAIFNAMVPSAATINYSGSMSDIASNVTGMNSKSPTSAAAGISNIFMNSLKIQSIYDTNGNKVGTAIGDPFKIVLIGVVGVIIMITAALSFLLAAIAFIARLVILLFLLAFSPLWFAGMIIPQLKDYMGKFKDHLTSQLVFMPVYLLLMYAALSVLNTSNLIGAASSSVANASKVDNWAFSYMVLGINFAMVIFMLNLPLAVGLAMGGSSTKFLKKYMDKWDAGKIWQNFGSQAGSRTLGRMAYKANDSRPMKYLTSRLPSIGGLASGGLSSISTAGFGGGKKGGYEARLAAKKKGEEAMHKQLGNVDRADYKTDEAFNAAKDRAKAYQAKYRANLPWKASVGNLGLGGMIGFMVDNRANRQTAGKLNKQAQKEVDKEEAKQAKFLTNDIDSKVQAITEQLVNIQRDGRKNENDMKKLVEKIRSSEKVNTARKTLGLESTTASEENTFSSLQSTNASIDQTVQTLREQRLNLLKQKGELRDKIQKGKEIEDEERNDKLLKSIEDLDKKLPKDEGGGGKKGGEEKK